MKPTSLLPFESAIWRQGRDPRRGSWRGRLRSRLNSPIVLLCWFSSGRGGGGGAITWVAADSRHFVRAEACRCRSRPPAAPTRCDPTLIGAAPPEKSDLFQREREAPRVLCAVTSRWLPRWSVVPAASEEPATRRRFSLTHSHHHWVPPHPTPPPPRCCCARRHSILPLYFITKCYMCECKYMCIHAFTSALM